MLDTAILTRAIDVKVGDDLLLGDGTTITVRSVDWPPMHQHRTAAAVTLGYFANGTRQTMHLPSFLEVKVRSITAAVINPLIARLEGATGNDVPGLMPNLDRALDEMRATVLVEAKHALEHQPARTAAEDVVLVALILAITRRR